MYNGQEPKNKDYKMYDITNNSPKRGGFFRSSLRSREDLVFLKNRDEDKFGNYLHEVKQKDYVPSPDTYQPHKP